MTETSVETALKVGDKVTTTSPYPRPLGTVGTIVQIRDEEALVQFPEWTGGHSGGMEYQLNDDGSRDKWYMYKKDLALAAVPEEDEDLEQFKARVRRVTKKYAKTHDLCDVVDDFLEDLGIPSSIGIPEPTEEGTVVSHLRSDGTVTGNEVYRKMLGGASDTDRTNWIGTSYEVTRSWHDILRFTGDKPVVLYSPGDPVVKLYEEE